MSSPNPYPEDELNHLVRGALHARVGGTEPPDRVWKQIRRELEADRRPSPARPRVAWLPLGLQVALTLLLLMLGGVGLRTVLAPDLFHSSSRETFSSGTVIYLEERSSSSREVVNADDEDVHLLKTLSRTRSVSLLQDVPSEQPPLVVPPDAPPHPSSAEGRLLAAALSPPDYPVIAESRTVLGGPY